MQKVNTSSQNEGPGTSGRIRNKGKVPEILRSIEQIAYMERIKGPERIKNPARMEGLELEICVDSLHSALEAEKGGATRIELCASLSEGGLTPSAGLMLLARKQLHIDIHVLIRPRRGDFLYTDLEFEIMKQDIKLARELGANGLVLGILKANGQVDVERTAALIELAAPLSITFHRAFDMCADPFKALEELKQLRIDRLLTSGQQETALAGSKLIHDLVKAAGDQLIIMPGGGICDDNIEELLAKTGAKAYHASARTKTASKMSFRNNALPMAAKNPLSEYENLHADKALISRIRKFI